MAKQFDRILPEHAEFIARQHLFFTASAAPTGRVNVSPRGLDTLRLFGDRTAAYLDLTGSGNETAAHLRLSPRLTLMFCAFEGPPLILRLYGMARTHPNSGNGQRPSRCCLAPVRSSNCAWTWCRPRAASACPSSTFRRTAQL